ncbi:hypothetical protein L208DRAFT_690230 [Tricholoma matsutake]|nr:hypothetical protein L208DRAFT_690230 [Tricholoma matsutake 945]
MAGKAVVATEMTLMLARGQGAMNEPTCQTQPFKAYVFERREGLSPDIGMRGVGKEEYTNGAARTGNTIVAAVPMESQKVHGGTSSVASVVTPTEAADVNALRRGFGEGSWLHRLRELKWMGYDTFADATTGNMKRLFTTVQSRNEEALLCKIIIARSWELHSDSFQMKRSLSDYCSR